jgi:hypothetical protein
MSLGGTGFFEWVVYLESGLLDLVSVCAAVDSPRTGRSRAGPQVRQLHAVLA